MTEVEDNADAFEEDVAQRCEQGDVAGRTCEVRVHLDKPTSSSQDFRKLSRNAVRRRFKVDRSLVTKVAVLDAQTKGRAEDWKMFHRPYWLDACGFTALQHRHSVDHRVRQFPWRPDAINA